MINFTLNSKKVSIPSSWEDVTFRQYCEILKNKKNTSELIAMFSGIDYEIIKKATIIGLDQVLIALSFLNKVPVIPDDVPKIGPYSLVSRQKLQFESLDLFEDMRGVAVKADPANIVDFTERYGTYVAMYLQKVRDGEYSREKADAMKEEVDSLPALQVISLGSFFFVKLAILLSGTVPNSRPTTQSQKKLKPGTTSYRKRSASTGRSRKSR